MTENSASTVDAAPRRGLDRRTVLTAGAWSVPVIAFAAAAPSAAASVAQNCRFDVVLTPTSDITNPLVLTATSPFSGEVYKVVITSAIDADTTTGEDITGEGFVTRNLARDGSGINGASPADGSNDWIYSGFGPDGAIVLNQRTSTVPGDDTVPVAGSDRQTLTFQFFDGSDTLLPTVGDFAVTVFDISSAVPEDADPAVDWRQTYWDAVGFSATPDSITTTGPYPAGTGAGTLAQPYHRIGENDQTIPDEVIEDTFTFGTFPSNGQLAYTQHNSLTGWHFISVSGIQFTVAECIA
jgi:hypothetical protein